MAVGMVIVISILMSIARELERATNMLNKLVEIAWNERKNRDL
jgi:hypothetical protein